MGSEAVDVVNRWRASSFEREAVEAVLAGDVEWVIARGGGTTLRGIDAVLEWYGGGAAAEDAAPNDLGGPEQLDVSEERGELEDLGEGRVGSLNRLIYTWKETGEVARVQTGRLVYTVRDGKIVRYELENLSDEPGSAAAPAD